MAEGGASDDMDGAEEPGGGSAARVADRAAPARAAVLVCGMHRSGTSALTRVLSLLGCDLPATLLPPSPGDNDAGFWESRPVMALNEEILASAGGGWNDWTAFGDDWLRSAAPDRFLDRATATLDAEFGESRLFVLKDPRLCRLLPFWLEALDRVGAAPHVVIPVRNPLEVARSLQARNGMEPADSHMFWLRHALDAERWSRGLPRAFTSYGALLENWAGVAERVGAALGVAWPRRLAAAGPEVEAFLTPDARRQRAEDDALLADPRLSRWLRETYGTLLRWTRDETREGDLATLDAARAALDDATPAIGPIVEAGRAAAREARLLRGRLDAEERRRAGIETQLRAAREASETAAQALAVASAETERVRKEADRAREETAAAAADAARAREDAARAREEAVRAREDAARREVESRAARDAVETLTRVAAARSAEIAALTRMALAAEDAASEAEELAARLAEAEGRIGRLTERAQAQAAEVDAATRARAAALAAFVAALDAGERSRPPFGLDPGGLRRRARLARGAARLRASGLFDADWYLRRHPDVAASGMEPAAHFLLHGHAEGRAPGPGFERGRA